MEYEDLLREADSNGIEVIEMNFKGGSRGIYSDDVIALNSNSTNKEKNCILSEELGHHYTTYGNIVDENNTNNIKQEKKARNWGYEKLVGIVDLINAFEKGIRSKHEIAEYLNITEEFLGQAIQHYREKYGTFCEIDNYLVYFEPNLTILKMF